MSLSGQTWGHHGRHPWRLSSRRRCAHARLRPVGAPSRAPLPRRLAPVVRVTPPPARLWSGVLVRAGGPPLWQYLLLALKQTTAAWRPKAVLESLGRLRVLGGYPLASPAWQARS